MTSPELRTKSRSADLPPASRFAGRRVHFIGIGGSGMAGLAKVLMDCGAVVSGSDPNFNEQTGQLAKRGARITRDQLGQLLDRSVDLVVRTAAVRENNPEYLAAQRLGLPTIKYAQLLGQVMQERWAIAVAGTHGKTTTTSMIAHALTQCGADPSYVIGGTVPQLGGSSRSGSGRSFVVEACEYDRSFHNLFPSAAVLTNIEADHLDCYKNLADIVGAFRTFAAIVPQDGLILANGRDANVAAALENVGRPVQWIALSPEADFGVPATHPLDWETTPLPLHNGCHAGVVRHNGREVGEIRLSVPGVHNLYNATLAVAACVAAGVDPAEACRAVSTFGGVDRRMTLVGQYRGATLVDDYGHHPTEIRTTLQAVRDRWNPKRLIAVFQPHQHSRTRTLMDEFATCFHGADLTLIADIYAVRDSDEEKRLTTTPHLVARVNAAGDRAVHVPTFPEMVAYLKREAGPGDLILTIGAGTICDVAKELAAEGA